MGLDDQEITSYLNKESYYNQFVYDNYTYIGLTERELLASNIGSSGDQSNGHLDYKLAINSVRNYLENEFVYSEDLGGRSTSGKNELEEFLNSRKGFDVHYATLATLIFRYYGIPARYVEGYILPEEEIKDTKDGEEVTVKKDSAHAWTEIYIDGIGFIPLEVTPEFYGIMKEADMNVGISNESLVSEYQKQFGNNGISMEEDEPTDMPGGNEAVKFLWYGLIAVLIIALIILSVVILKKIITVISNMREKNRLFHKEDPKKSVAAIYSYIEKENLRFDNDVVYLGNRAAYSKENITEEDRNFMLNKYKELKKLAKNTRISFIVILLLLILPLASCSNKGISSHNSTEDNLDSLIKDVCTYLIETIPDPTISPVGGDWMIFALSKSGCDIPDSYYGRYFDNVRAELKKKSGILSEDRYTEYERVIIGLDSIGKDPREVEGYDLTKYLDDYDVITNQGVNAAWYALIAINVADLEISNETNYVEYVKNSIETKEYDGAGLSDYLSIGLQALSFYGGKEIESLIGEGIDTLAGYMQSDGSLGNCESTAMCIIALAMNGVDPINDERFIKDGTTLFDGLMNFYLNDGSFCHTNDIEESNLMATEEALAALEAIRLYNMGEKLYS